MSKIQDVQKTSFLTIEEANYRHEFKWINLSSYFVRTTSCEVLDATEWKRFHYYDVDDDLDGFISYIWNNFYQDFFDPSKQKLGDLKATFYDKNGPIEDEEIARYFRKIQKAIENVEPVEFKHFSRLISECRMKIN